MRHGLRVVYRNRRGPAGAVALSNRRFGDTHAINNRKTGQHGKQGKKQFHLKD